MSAGCSASELNLGNKQCTWPQCAAMQHPSVMEAKSPDDVSAEKSWADKSFPSELPAFPSHGASLRTGCEPHWPGDALRHLGSETQAGPGTSNRTVCAGPARARFGSIAWPSDNFFEVGRKDQGPVIAPRLASPAYAAISLPIVGHMIAAGRFARCRDPPCRVEV